MKFGVLGTGVVGTTIATRLARDGPQVETGSRTAGVASLEALRLAGAANLLDEIVVDVASPLDLTGGMSPTLTVCNTDSLGEQIQRAFPALFLCGNDAEARPAVNFHIATAGES